MNFTMDWSFFGTVLIGSAAQELLHWYDLRGKLSQKRVSALLRSPGYWLITVAVVMITPLCCWLLFSEDDLGRQMQFLSGAAFPVLFRKTVSTFSFKDQTNLGDNTVQDYFLMYSVRSKS